MISTYNEGYATVDEAKSTSLATNGSTNANGKSITEKTGVYASASDSAVMENVNIRKSDSKDAKDSQDGLYKREGNKTISTHLKQYIHIFDPISHLIHLR